MFFDEYKKLNNNINKTPNNYQNKPTPEDISKTMIYKKYKSSSIFNSTTNSNNNLNLKTNINENINSKVNFIKNKNFVFY